MLTSCAIFSKPSEPIQPPAPFEEAISALAGNLLDRVKADRPDSTGKDKIHVMLIPFTDADTDEVPQISRRIENIFIAEGSRKFRDFDLARLTSKNISQVDYIINGTIRMDLYQGKDAGKVQKYYRVYGEVTRLKDKKINGQDLDTYAGLYLANYKLSRLEEAEKAFSRLIAISAEKYRSFTVKYLFGVNSVEFLKDKTLAERYQTWIRNIGKYFQDTNNCLRIVGHSSRTESEEYNDKLSIEQAKSIQTLLQKSFPEVFQRSKIVGKGFSENIVGTGTDDDGDALDRRVELFVIECK